MARVVQRTNAPPYLLIVTVMLLVLAIAIAAIIYNKYSKAEQVRVAAEAELDRTSRKLRDCENKDIPDLVKAVTGRTVTPAAALAEAQQCSALPHAKPYADGGLVSVVNGLVEKEIANRDARITQLQAAETQLKESLSQKDTDLENLKVQYGQKQQADATALKAAQGKLEQAVKAKDAQLQQAVKEKDAIIDQKVQQVAVMDRQMNDLRLAITQRDARIVELEEELGRKKPSKPDTLTRADGEISSVMLEQGICYVNLGRKDRASRGLTFSVYSARTGVSKKDPGKAKIVVISVGERTSECRIIKKAPEDPILEGDLVVNLAYDSSRVHKFVVEGDFDLYGRGRPDPLGKDRVEKLIESWGATVTKNVTVDVDCVVMGSEPTAPSKPATDAPPQEWEIYRLALKRYQHYHDVRDAARKLRITILNTTQFLAFSGFVLGTNN